MHLYIVVDCKTKNCQSAHVLTHLGEKGTEKGWLRVMAGQAAYVKLGLINSPRHASTVTGVVRFCELSPCRLPNVWR